MTMSRAPPSSYSCQNPFDIQIVFKVIMRHVGTDHNSLLACRLVSRYWNDMAVEVLRDNGSVLSIGRNLSQLDREQGNYSEFLRALSTEREPNHKNEFASALRILHVELDVNSLSSAGARIQWQIANAIPKSEQAETPIHRMFRAIEPNANSGLVITSIVYDIRCDPHPHAVPLNPVDFKALVKACAPSLKYLTYKTGLSQSVGEYDPPLEAQVSPAEFPNLISIHIHLTNVRIETLWRHPLPILMANSAPNLQVFDCTYNAWPLSPMRHNFFAELDAQTPLTKLIAPETRARISELKLALPHWGALTSDTFLTGFKCALVRKLSLQLEIEHVKTPELEEKLNNFLQNCLPSLESLELHWKSDPPHQNQHNPRFPYLRNLAHFGITSMWAVPSAAQDSLFINRYLDSIASRNLTIKTFSIDPRSYCAMRTRKFINEFQVRVPLYSDIVFPNVDTLALNGPWFEQLPPNHIASMTRAMFPNLRKVTLDLGPWIDEFEQHFLHGLLAIEGVRHLEFLTYYKNWLCTPALEASVIPRSLEHLVLKVPTLPKSTPARLLSKPDSFPLADLEYVIHVLPRLKSITVHSKLLVDRRNRTDFSSIMKELQQLRRKFPSVDIRIPSAS